MKDEFHFTVRVSLDGIRINGIHYESLYTLTFEAFQILFIQYFL